MVILINLCKGHVMATAAVFGLIAGKRPLSSSSFYYSSDLNDKLFFSAHDLGVSMQFSVSSSKNVILAKVSTTNSGGGPDYHSNGHTQSVKALNEHVDTSPAPPNAGTRSRRSSLLDGSGDDLESSLEILILLQKSMLEKQWNLSSDRKGILDAVGGAENKMEVVRSGISARRRRRSSLRRDALNQTVPVILQSDKTEHVGATFDMELLQGQLKGYVKGVTSRDLLSHEEVMHLSKKIKTGLSLEKHRSRLKVRLGCEPSDEQLASSLRVSRAELHSKMIECSLAREKLAMSNVRLVMSVAQKYDNLGAEMADLIQGGLIGLLRGIEKFDSSKGFKISTYLYWWIRRGVARALVENSRILRLPVHLHERLRLIRNTKIRLEEKGITPSIDRIAKNLNMSQKKVRNATEAVSKVFSLDREAFPLQSGLSGESRHSYIADNKLENNPWHGVDEWLFKDEVNKLIGATLSERERYIIRLYYGLDGESHTWEDISKEIGLSRERVRQVGLVAMQILKHAARNRGLEAMLVKH